MPRAPTACPATGRCSDWLAPGPMRTRKDINQTNLDGQHLDPTVSLINAVETTCQGNSWNMFYYRRFSKSSKKFDLNTH
jgi:hypothetical protein